MSKVVLSILVNNTSGVLSRVAGLFSRRGYNIDSLTVGETENPAFSRMTVSVTGDDIVLEQIEKQVNKLEDVKSVKQLTGEASVCRELILVKVEADKDARPAINAIVDIFRAKIVDVAEIMPEFPGGTAALMKYLGTNIKYPTISQEMGSAGRVIVQFVVDKDGSISNPEVVRGVDAYLDKEAIRVISSMPKWRPGVQNGKKVRVKYTVPVVFRLQ